MSNAGRMFVGVLFAALFSLPSLWAQAKPSKEGTKQQERTLRLVETVQTNVSDELMVLPFACDADGNAYVQLYDISAVNRRGAILKFNSKGEKTVKFSNSQPDLSPFKSFVARDGSVFELSTTIPNPSDPTTRMPDIYVVRYQKDGTYQSRTKLDRRFRPTGSFVVFPSGQVLVAALDAQEPGEKTFPSTPITALFDENGEMLRRITLKPDADIVKAVETGDENTVMKGRETGGNLAVSRGLAVIGSDGNAYLLRKAQPAIVYVISPAGELVRTLNLPSGSPPLFPLLMLESEGQLAVLFRNDGPGEGRIRIFNSVSGELVQSATVDASVGSALACFHPPQRFVFFKVNVKERKFALNIAEVQ